MTRHKHSIIHGHTKPTKNETRKVPTGEKVGIATHNSGLELYKHATVEGTSATEARSSRGNKK